MNTSKKIEYPAIPNKPISQFDRPEVAERLRAVDENGVIPRSLRRLNRWTMPKLDSVIALDGAMAALLVDGGAPSDRVHVIPNWERAALYTADTPTVWEGYRRLGLEHRFVVLYLGNVGLGHHLETVLDAAPELADDGVTFLFVGGGPRWDELAERSARIDNVVLEPYVDKDRTPSVLAGAETSLICLEERALGVMSPSKVHGSLGMGVPVLYVGPNGSNVSEAIAAHGCGVEVTPGDIDGLVQAVRTWRDHPERRSHAAARARSAFETAYSDRATLPLWDELLDRPEPS